MLLSLNSDKDFLKVYLRNVAKVLVTRDPFIPLNKGLARISRVYRVILISEEI